jgi:hypothetical protein
MGNALQTIGCFLNSAYKMSAGPGMSALPGTCERRKYSGLTKFGTLEVKFSKLSLGLTDAPDV